MTRAALIMACVSATSAAAGAAVLIMPARSEQGVYGKRIAGTMFCAMALILAVFAWGLERMAG
jgi:hypothetical protein